MDSAMTVFVRRRKLCLYASVAIFVVGIGEAVAISRPPSQTQFAIAQISPAEREKQVNDLIREADATDDVLRKKELYLEAREIDPGNMLVRQLLADTQIKIDELTKDLGKGAVAEKLRSDVEDALKSNDEAKLNEVKRELESALKTDLENKEWQDKLKSIEDRLKNNAASVKSRTVREHAEAAIASNDRKKLKEALKEVNEILVTNPNDADLLRLKGELENRSRQKDTVWKLQIVALVILAVGLIAGVLYLLLRKRKALLIFADGDRAGEVFLMEQPKATIGALPENQLVVMDEIGKISRCHCEIFKEGRRYFINDTSRNGTWLNDKKLDPGRPRVLRKGDHVSLAGQVTLVFRLK